MATKTKQCVVVLVTNGRGHLAMCRRKDNGKWTLVAGHLEDGESPQEAAYREIQEETGLKAKFLSLVTTRGEGDSKVHFFSTQCNGDLTTKNDPDEECDKLQWVDTRNGIPKNIYNKLHGPSGDENIVRQIYDLKKSEDVWLDECGFADLSKAEAETEVSKLLKHPNPTERTLALKLKSVTPHDVAVAILDPHPGVWGAAFDHKDSAHAHRILATNSRDAAGNALWERHNLLIKDPRFDKGHLQLMAHAVRKDRHLPPKEQADRLRFLASNGYVDLVKASEWAHTLLFAGSTQGAKVTDHSKEETHEHLKPLKQQFESNLHSNEAIEPHSAGLHDVGQVSPKVVYKVGDQRVMVKPYGEADHPLAGWSEGSSQAVFHAAGLGHLHQQSFVSSHGSGKYNIPASVIKLDDKAVPIHKAALSQVREQNPAIEDEARKVSVMDFLTGNFDRHSNNLMVQPNGHLLAIDNAAAFKSIPKPLSFYVHSGASTILGSGHLGTPEGKEAYTKLFKDWWPSVSADVKRSFNKRLDLVNHSTHKQRLQDSFNEKIRWLDKKTDEARNGSISNFDDFVAPRTSPGSAELAKKAKDAEFLSSYENFKVPGLHESLMDKHPASINDSVQHFEKHINNSTDTIHPDKVDPGGMDVKALYSHTGKRYMVKPSVFKGVHDDIETPYSAWNEMTSQAMYHAGNIGHLHQKVHCSVVNNDFQSKDGHGLVIHMEPNAHNLYQAPKHLRDRLNNSPDIKKIGFMDTVCFNRDRHSGNIMVKEDGSPLAIDHSLCFRNDLNPNFSYENQDMYYSSPGENLFSLKEGAATPDADTWAWWDQNKDAIQKAFHKHADLVPDKKDRNRLKDSFNYRMEMIENGNTPLGRPIRNTLAKKMQDVGFLHLQHHNKDIVKAPDMSGVHEKLMMSTPDAIKPHRLAFENNINQSQDIIKPLVNYSPQGNRGKASDMGEEPKAIFHHGGKGYMVKAAGGPSTKMSGWNEMTSQAMYHAGGIGHLHQKVHATTLPQGMGMMPNQRPHGIVVHLHPDAITVEQAAGGNDPRLQKMTASKEHLGSLKKIGVMDWLTANRDRHEGNIMVAPDGSPLAIDHGRSMSFDREHALGHEVHPDTEAKKRIDVYNSLPMSDEERQAHIARELAHSKSQKEWVEKVQNDPHAQHEFFDNFNGTFSDATKLGGSPNKDTMAWWGENKHKIRDAFIKHLNMLPDENVRNKMQRSFDIRWNHLNDYHERFNSQGPGAAGYRDSGFKATGKGKPSQEEAMKPTTLVQDARGFAPTRVEKKD